MATYDISISPASGTIAPMTVTVDCGSGQVKLTGHEYIGKRGNASGGMDYLVVCTMEAAGGSGPNSLSIGSTDLIPGKTVKRDDSSNDRLVFNVVLWDTNGEIAQKTGESVGMRW